MESWRANTADGKCVMGPDCLVVYGQVGRGAGARPGFLPEHLSFV